jgi:hypothetical protein
LIYGRDEVIEASPNLLTERGEKPTQNDDENRGRPSEDFVFSTPTEVQFISLILIRVLERLDSFHMTSHSSQSRAVAERLT